MSGRLRRADLWSIALRANLLQATFNYERQQGLGWAFCLEPALERFVPDPPARARRLAEHTAYFNTQPTLCSVALGAVAGIEEQRAEGAGPDAETVARIKGALGSALAALGDRLFWQTLRPFAACVGVLLTLAGSPWGALAMWVCYNLVHLGVRFAGVGWGYRSGPGVLSAGLRGHFERLTGALGDIGSALIGVVVAFALAPRGMPKPIPFQVTLAGGLIFGLLSAQRARPSPTQYALALGALCVLATWWR